MKPGELQDAGYGEVFCHPTTAVTLLEEGLTIDDYPARGILVGIWSPTRWQVKLKVDASQDWWAYGKHVVRTGARNRELQQAALLESVSA